MIEKSSNQENQENQGSRQECLQDRLPLYFEIPVKSCKLQL
jgi:hypothetical protein